MTPRARALIELLIDGQPHSGAAIADAIGISRTAVWKILHQLDDELGLGLESVRGQGYRLPEPLELLSSEAICSKLDRPARQRIGALEILDEIDSTNAYLLERGRQGRFNNGEICLAERQSAGRGRLGRHWVSPFGRNIYLSILWCYPLAPAQLGGLSLACGVAIARALQGLGVEGIGLKWPNDVHWQRRKLAGLLLEVAGEAQGPSRVVVGVGINLGLRAADAEAINQPWVDLTEVCGGERPTSRAARRGNGAGCHSPNRDVPVCHVPSRNVLAATLIDHLTATLLRYADAGLAPFLEDWRTFDAYNGEPVVLIAGQQRIEGWYRGIDCQGNLRLDTTEGQRTFAAGEVSVRLKPSAPGL
ncbi:biotin--[acetyl-CoA-carboxylase] ligase [Halochromatium salexigens]|uniref:Bifunctional ligase/repressor BirA n=2 Tax=Halochromatium salexigens TaxID=49447 RepID=A0AAJ0UIQ3_HALSE|nr:biotin--[acetyl-CoA-carboxylase] ligase [Halochromatium salexigens]